MRFAGKYESKKRACDKKPKIKVEKIYKYVSVFLQGLVERPRSIMGGEVLRYFYFKKSNMLSASKIV